MWEIINSLAPPEEWLRIEKQTSKKRLAEKFHQFFYKPEN
jgi:hypothetical protein